MDPPEPPPKHATAYPFTIAERGPGCQHQSLRPRRASPRHAAGDSDAAQASPMLGSPGQARPGRRGRLAERAGTFRAVLATPSAAAAMRRASASGSQPWISGWLESTPITSGPSTLYAPGSEAALSRAAKTALKGSATTTSRISPARLSRPAARWAAYCPRKVRSSSHAFWRPRVRAWSDARRGRTPRVPAPRSLPSRGVNLPVEGESARWSKGSSAVGSITRASKALFFCRLQGAQIHRRLGQRNTCSGWEALGRKCSTSHPLHPRNTCSARCQMPWRAEPARRPRWPCSCGGGSTRPRRFWGPRTAPRDARPSGRGPLRADRRRARA
jgi:hypothetical protein